MASLVLEVGRSEGQALRASAYVFAIALVFSGAAGIVYTSSIAPGVGVVAGVLVYVWLFRTQTSTVYEPYLIIDDGGVHYQRSFGSRGRRSTYTWCEIDHPEALLASKGHELQGLQFKLKRQGLKGVPVVLPIHSEADCLAAFAAVELGLKKKRQ